MKILTKIQFIVISVLLFITPCCLPEHEYPVTPYIEYEDFIKVPTSQGIDDKGVLKISFTDGDGDIGLEEGDTTGIYEHGSEYHYNYFITYFERQNGVFIKVELPGSFNSRIPVISPKGEDKAIKGEIEIELFINNPNSNYDTIHFQAYIVDRALHHSNTITTPDIIVKKH